MTDQTPTDPLTVSHWGAYRVQTEGGRVTGITAFEGDPEPSPMIQAMPGVVHHECRIEQPMVRKGWLEDGHNSDTSGRGDRAVCCRVVGKGAGACRGGAGPGADRARQ